MKVQGESGGLSKRQRQPQLQKAEITIGKGRRAESMSKNEYSLQEEKRGFHASEHLLMVRGKDTSLMKIVGTQKLMS